jgi:hypothetical protein
MVENDDPIQYYATYGCMTDPGDYASLLEDLPPNIAGLCEIVQNNLIHIFWAERYGIELTEEQKQTVNIRHIADKLALIYSVNANPLVVKRDISSRQVDNCRDFSLFLTTFLRFQGTPARSRCGFGAYFLPDHFEDHWVCEYWNNQQSSWIMVDSQLDPFQKNTLGIKFDPLDVPHDQFITAGRAWQMCRSGKARPDQFGIFDMHGWWFIWGNVIRDFLSLNKSEILPWDSGWGFLTHALSDPLPNEQELTLFDQIANLSASPYRSFSELRRLMQIDSRCRLPANY